MAREGNEYHAAVEPEGEGYIVTLVQEKHDGRRLMVRKKGDGITGINAKRSVNLGLMASDGNGIVPAGNVTIPPNHKIPGVGEVCETRYLYTLRQSGSIFQPVYLGPRTDIPASDCTVDQLKYKVQAEAA